MRADNPVRCTRHGAVALIAINNPPVNALGQRVRQAILDAFDWADAQAEVEAVVLYGAGQNFIAGADIREFHKPPEAPFLPAVCNRIERSSLLVIAAIHGVCLGGGLEVALSAHYRIAHPDAVFGFPEVTLGLIPGAGGTQRLPRLCGAAAALDLISTGKRVSAQDAKHLGFLDRIETGSASEFGLDYAQELLSKGASRRLVRFLPTPAAINWKVEEEPIRKRAKGRIAPVAAVQAIRASAEHPFEEGLAEERRIFNELMQSDQRQALVHVFFAERRASAVPPGWQVKPRDVNAVGILGGGTMGAGIASAVLMAGIPVTLVETSDAAAVSARDRILQNLEGAIQRGKVTRVRYEKAIGEHLSLSRHYSALSEVDLVIEAVFEDMAIKKAVFDKLDKVCKPDAILATNTSYLDVNEIADATSRPQNVIGLHFFSPAHVMKLLEIVVPDRANPQAAVSAFGIAKRLGKQAVRAGVAEGFIGNRILNAYRTAADHVVLAGASPREVDYAMESFGFAMGPFAVADIAGLDIGWANRKRIASKRDPREDVAAFPDHLCQAGYFGRKSGQGYYVYSDVTPNTELNPKAIELIEAERAARGIIPQAFTRNEISSRLVAAIVNEAARAIDEGVAQRPLDVDVVMIAGYGFPRHCGGPCKWADQKGLAALLSEIETYREIDPYFWRPALLLEQLVDKGQLFDDLNQAAEH